MTIHQPLARPYPITAEKTRLSLLMVFFTLFIFMVPLFWLIRGNDPNEWSLLEARKFEQFQFTALGIKTAFAELKTGDPQPAADLFTALLIDRAFQTQTEKAASDQFPLRSHAIKTSKALDRLTIKTAYLPLPDPNLPADTRSNIFVSPDQQTLFYGPDKLDQWTRMMVDLRLANYRELLATHPQLNFYVYTIERLQNLPFHPLVANFPTAEAGQYYETFSQNKPDGLHLGTLHMASLADYFRYFYRTDHHLNNLGAYTAYLDIYHLLQAKYPAISPPRQVTQELTLPDIAYRGSLARLSLYPIPGEPFKVYLYDLPPFQTYKDGQQFTYGKQDHYLAGNNSTAPYLNHYGEYYGYDEGFLEFVFEGQPDRNLLVIGDSYDNAFLTLLASHYRRTYSVDLRNYPDFSLSTFLKDHPVQDVLVVGSNVAAYTSIDWTINP